VAYPTVLDQDLAAVWELILQDRQVTLMVDCVEHVKVLEKYAFRHRTISSTAESVCFRVAIDVDVSWRLFGGAIHIGVQRSGVRSIKQFARVLDAILRAEHLHFVGVMGYGRRGLLCVRRGGRRLLCWRDWCTFEICGLMLFWVVCIYIHQGVNEREIERESVCDVCMREFERVRERVRAENPEHATCWMCV
jgi:hypothetical protein